MTNANIKLFQSNGVVYIISRLEDDKYNIVSRDDPTATVIFIGTDRELQAYLQRTEHIWIGSR